MQPIEGLEFALRLQPGPARPEEIAALITELVNEPGVDAKRILSDAQSRPDMFRIEEDGRVGLTKERLANRIEFFRESVWSMRHALRLMPMASSNWSVIALVYALAIREEGTLPLIGKKDDGLWPTLDLLTAEYPQLKRELDYAWQGGIMVTAQVQSALLRMASTRLTPMEYVQELRYLVSADGRSGQFCLQWPVAELMTKLLGEKVQEVFDPSADASVIPVVMATSPGGSIKANAVFVDPFAQYFNQLQAKILGAELNSLNWDDLGPGGRAGGNYTHCISAPPLGGRIMEKGAMRAIEPYELAINQIIKRMASNGQAVVLVPESMLFSTSRSILRKNILDEGLLRTVISLPTGALAPYAMVKTSILVLDRSLPASATVQFVDASRFVTTERRAESRFDIVGLLDEIHKSEDLSVVRQVAVDEIRAQDHDLHAARYFFRAEDVIEDGVRLGDHVTPVSLERFAIGSKVPFARIRDLKEDTIDHTLQQELVEVGEVPRHAKKLDRSALLLAMRYSNLKPTWFEYNGTPIAVTSDILVVDVDQNTVDIPYLIHELLSAKVQGQVERLNRGVVIPSLRQKDILDLLIELPPKPEQQAKVKGLREAHVEALRKKAEQEAERHGIQLQQIGNTVSFKHRLGTPLLSVGSGIDTMRMSLDRIQPAWRDLVVSAREQITLGAIMDNVTYELQRISAMLDADSLELEVEKYPLEPMDLVAYAKKATRRAQADLNGGHEVSIFMSADINEQLKGKAPIMGNRALLDIAMDALVDNARRHGFAQEQGPHRLDIRVGLRVDDKQTWLVLAVANSGKPFPEGFGLDRYIRKSVYAGPTGHTGIGGYHVNEIVKHHKGYLELITRPKLMGPLSSEIELYFPLAH